MTTDSEAGETDQPERKQKGVFDLDAVKSGLGRLVHTARIGTEKAGSSVRRFAHDAKSNIDRRGVERRRQQLVLSILERWVYLNRDVLAEDATIKALFKELDTVDAELKEFGDEDEHAEPDPKDSGAEP